MKKNIKLIYITTALSFSWFWYGVWIPFYLIFTNYAGVGIIEMFAVLSGFIFEVPSGAVADLLGKKKTLQLAFLVGALGSLTMALSQNLNHLTISTIICALCHALFSGTNQALIYDSLKQIKKDYDEDVKPSTDLLDDLTKFFNDTPEQKDNE